MNRNILRQLYTENRRTSTQNLTNSTNSSMSRNLPATNTPCSNDTPNLASQPSDAIRDVLPAITSQRQTVDTPSISCRVTGGTSTAATALGESDNNSMSTMLQTMITMQQQMSSLQQSVINMQQRSSSTVNQEDCSFLNKAYHRIGNISQSAPQSTGTSRDWFEHPCETSVGVPIRNEVFLQRHMGPNGLPADLLPHLDVVSPTLRKCIQAGKDVNLITLLIPGYELTSSDSNSISRDKRLSQNLTISEFVQAFGKYKRIMCEAYPQRRDELDLYENFIIRIHTLYGDQAFNDYHRLFSAQSEESLRGRTNTKVDWSFKDTAIYGAVTAGRKAKVCETCNSVMHITSQCPQASRGSRPPARSQSDNDKFGRERQFHGGREICNNFNTVKGCAWKSCRFLHQCMLCKGPSHGKHICKTNKSQNNP